MPGYIYLIMTADGVYKVGRTSQNYGTHIKRLKSYPRDSIIKMVLAVRNEVYIEKEVLRKCRQEFGTHPRGAEYFTGPEERFVEIIYDATRPLACVEMDPRFFDTWAPSRPDTKVMELPLDWWDGQPIHVKVMIREIHKALERSRAFKFQDLVDQLLDRGYVVNASGMVVKDLDFSLKRKGGRPHGPPSPYI